MSAGILCEHQVSELICPDQGRRRLRRPSGEDWDNPDASSIDLPIGEKYWEMEGSCRAGRDLNVEDIIDKCAKSGFPKTIDSDGMVLRKEQVYLFQLDCWIDLEGTHIQGKSTARSSVGRLDVLVRLLVNRGEVFDRIPARHIGDLFVEIAPITFDIIVRPGTCLSQLRLFKGGEHLISLTNDALFHEDEFPVVDASGEPMREECKRDPHSVVYPFCLNLDPDPHAQCSGFVAKTNCPDAIDPMLKQHYNPTDFWEPCQAKKSVLTLETNRLYILRSKERLRIPAHLALECQAYTEAMGEWRIEYAGFAHPFFGSTSSSGTPLMFEVRGHNIRTLLTNGIPLGNVCFGRMSQAAEKPSSPGQYEKQELKLSGCFKDWPT